MKALNAQPHPMVHTAPLLLAGGGRIVVFVATKSGEGTTTVATEFLEGSLGQGLILCVHQLRQVVEVRIFGLDSDNIDLSSLRPWAIRPSPPTLPLSQPLSLATNCLHDPAFWQVMRSLDVCVVVDAPSLVSSSLGLVAARHADTTILVVAAEDTRHHVAAYGRDLLQASGAQVAGVVLNKRQYYIPEHIYRGL